MTPAAKLEQQVTRLGWVTVLLSIAAILLQSSRRTLERAAKRMAELEIDKEQSEELLNKRARQLDGALEELHAAKTGSALDGALDTQGSGGEGPFDSQGSTQPDQG